MTDNDIIKALECCGVKGSCTGCYFNTHKAEDICARIVIQKALDLINRQKAEIERLQSVNQAELDMIHDIRAELKTAQAENERLQKYNTEYARKHYNDGRAEAITEFEERLKKRSVV